MKPLSELAPELWATFDDKKKENFLFMEKVITEKETPYKEYFKIKSLTVPTFRLEIKDFKYLGTVYTKKGILVKTLYTVNIYCNYPTRYYPKDREELFLENVQIEICLKEPQDRLQFEELGEYILSKINLDSILKNALLKVN